MEPRLALTALMALSTLAAGCLGSGSEVLDPGTTPDLDAGITPVRSRADLPFAVGEEEQTFSRTLVQGPHGILEGFSAFVDVAVPLGNGLPVQQAHMGVFLPDIEGCDWEAGDLAEACKVPVVADVGPYFSDGDVDATQPANRLGRFLIENLVPHGYAVAQVSVLGTGRSGGCMDLMGEVEQAGVQAAVDWLGTQSWSNGNVGLIGRSYDGSTPWEAAMAGSAHLKTVVPISGLYGQHDLMWRNGSAETRGPGLLWAIYYTFTYTPTEPFEGAPGVPVVGNAVPAPGYAATHARHLAENTICPDTQTGGAQAVAAYLTGDRVVPAVNGYWTEREFRTEVLENYEGSVYFIHGMQDWNVDPHMAFPFYQELEAKGLEMKGLFGQWGHMYPDRPGEHDNLAAYPHTVRWDWAQDLKEWFDHYLKGTGPKPELHVEMQDDAGTWRIEETWPPRDLQWWELAFGAGLALADGSGTTVAPGLPDPSGGALPTGASRVLLRSEPLEEDLRIAGLPQLHVTVTPQGPGGQLYAELRAVGPDGDGQGRRVGHAIMDLRFAAGGEESRPVVPGQPLVARMEFFPLDAFVPAGSTLELVMANTGRDYLPSAVGGPVEVSVGADSALRLPVVQRVEGDFFTPPGEAWRQAETAAAAEADVA